MAYRLLSEHGHNVLLMHSNICAPVASFTRNDDSVIDSQRHRRQFHSKVGVREGGGLCFPTLFHFLFPSVTQVSSPFRFSLPLSSHLPYAFPITTIRTICDIFAKAQHRRTHDFAIERVDKSGSRHFRKGVETGGLGDRVPQKLKQNVNWCAILR